MLTVVRIGVHELFQSMTRWMHSSAAAWPIISIILELRSTQLWYSYKLENQSMIYIHTCCIKPIEIRFSTVEVQDKSVRTAVSFKIMFQIKSHASPVPKPGSNRSQSGFRPGSYWTEETPLGSQILPKSNLKMSSSRRTTTSSGCWALVCVFFGWIKKFEYHPSL